MNAPVAAFKRRIDADIGDAKAMIQEALEDAEKLKITSVTVVMVSDDGDVYTYTKAAKQITHIGGLEMAKHKILNHD